MDTQGFPGLLLSPEVFDVSLAYDLMDKDHVAELGSEGYITMRALTQGDEALIRYIASKPEFEFEDFAKMALDGTLVLTDENSEEIPSPVLSLNTLEILFDPELGLDLGEVDYADAMTQAIKSNNMEAVVHLSRQPETNISTNEYLDDAVLAGNAEALEYLLSLEDIPVDVDVVENMLSLANRSTKLFKPSLYDGVVDVIMSHPRTIEFV